jgi:hypothetical protein
MSPSLHYPAIDLAELDPSIDPHVRCLSDEAARQVRHILGPPRSRAAGAEHVP